MSAYTDALARLDTFYNDGPYDGTTNPGGFDNNGHRVNFINSLGDVALVGDGVAAFATAASTSASDAALSAAKLLATSATALTITAASKVFTTQASKLFPVGGYILAVSAASPTTDFMSGQITAYSGTSLTANMTKVSGSGSHSDWLLYASAAPGVDGTLGWSPVPAAITDGARRVLQIIDWTGGTGTKPTTGLYVGASGLTATLASAVDFRGPAGAGSGDVTTTGSVATNDVAGFADATGDILKGLGPMPTLSSLGAQAADPMLTALAALTTVNDRSIYFTGADTPVLYTLTSFARTILDDADAATVLTTIGAQASSAKLTALAAQTWANDNISYQTGTGTVTNTAFTGTGRSVVGAADLAALKTFLALSGSDFADGSISGVKLAASARSYGKQMIPLLAGAFTSRTTNGASAGVIELTTNKIMMVTKDFDTTTKEYIQIAVPVPKSIDESVGVSFRVWWVAGSSGGVAFSLAVRATSDGDAIDGAMGTAVTVTDTYTTANYAMVTAESASITIGNSYTEGDMLWLELAREVANGSDTIAADVRVIAVEFYVTTNAGNDA